ncbi:MAG: hypothetical protein OEY05_02945 [Paracoccaceae bacterium]|nr:hypothetical protein [Paracoccaceae bacterium]MDH5528970.1 hypothetical protein [Paracoccaceae bacterium]
MTRKVYSGEYQREAAQHVTMRGVDDALAARDLDVQVTVPRSLVYEIGSDGPDTILGKGKLKPDDEVLRYPQARCFKA